MHCVALDLETKVLECRPRPSLGPLLGFLGVLLQLEFAGATGGLTGLKEGETVVSSSQFLIDSESKLREATAKMMESLKQDKDQGETSNGESK